MTKDKKQTILDDYLRCVVKFDACRSAIARCLERFGIEPYEITSEQDWHEALITELDKISP